MQLMEPGDFRKDLGHMTINYRYYGEHSLIPIYFCLVGITLKYNTKKSELLMIVNWIFIPEILGQEVLINTHMTTTVND